MKFKGTKEPCVVIHDINVESIGGRPICACGTFSAKEKRSQSVNKENAKLIADAFTTISKCDLLPSELLEQRNELLEALKDLVRYCEDNSVGAELELSKQAIAKTETI